MLRLRYEEKNVTARVHTEGYYEEQEYRFVILGALRRYAAAEDEPCREQAEYSHKRVCIKLRSKYRNVR